MPPEHGLRRVGGTESFAGLLKFPGVSGPMNSKAGTRPEIDQGNPAYPPELEVAKCPTAARLDIRFLTTSRALSRRGTIVLRYSFNDLGAV